MAEHYGADKRSKAEIVARVVEDTFEDLMSQCERAEYVEDSLHVGVIGYGNGAAVEVLDEGTGPAGLLTTGELAGKAYSEEVEIEEADGLGRLKVTKFTLRKWVEPICAGGKPMTEALRLACNKLKAWVEDYPNNFPPIVLNITDGKVNDPEAAEATARELQTISTSVGDALLFNCYISTTGAPTVEYPACDTGLPDDHARWFYRIASRIPDSLVRNAQAWGPSWVTTGSRGFMCNATRMKLMRFLRIGD